MPALKPQTAMDEFMRLFPPLAADHAEAIGHVVANWAKAENHLGHFLHMALGIAPSVALAITAELNVTARGNIIFSLIELTEDQRLIKEWEAIWKRLDTLRIARNDVVHAEWQPSPAGGLSIRNKARKEGLKITTGVVPTIDLKSLSNEIVALCRDLGVFGNDLALKAKPILSNPYLVRIRNRAPNPVSRAPLLRQSKPTKPRRPSSAQKRRAASEAKDEKTKEKRSLVHAESQNKLGDKSWSK